MKIKYEFATETVEVEVSAEMAAIHMELERQEYNNNQTETRRHTTLNNRNGEHEWLACDEYNPENILEADVEAKRIRKALSHLTTTQIELIEKVFEEDMPAKEYAALKGISPAAVSQQIRTIRKKLKKFL